MKPFYEIRSRRIFVGPICTQPFPLHVHMVVEIVHLIKGSLQLTVGNERCVMAPGDTVVCFPSVPHSYDVVPPEAQGLCLVFEAETIREFADSFRNLRPVSPLLKAETAGTGLLDSALALKELVQQENSPLLMGYLHVFLAHLLSKLPMEPLTDCVDTDLIQKTLQYVADHFDESLTLDSLSVSMGVSKSHLSRLFSTYLKINFRKYINILRIDEACTLLKASDMTVTEICYACGFNNPRTFHRAFLQETGMQPKDYRARKSQQIKPNEKEVWIV